MSSLWITILSFTVLIPFIAGIRLIFSRIPSALTPIAWLCGFWSVAEVYSYTLRIHGIINAHVSYVLSIIEFFCFAWFYAFACPKARRLLFVLYLSGIALVIAEYILLNTPFNTYSLAVEYVMFTCFAMYLLSEQLIGRASGDHLVINLTLLFYLLSSFPYFFAWEWLRITDMALLKVFSDVHAVVHSICYLIIAIKLWTSSSYYPVRL